MATQIEQIINRSKELMGASYIDASGMTYCQRFVSQCYRAAGINATAETAMLAGDKWIVSESKSNIPVGAAVYFKNGNTAGHVGIYIGNGKMRHVWSKGKVCETSIDVAKEYRGWGWNGGNEPTGAKTGNSSDNDSPQTESSEKKELCSTSVVSRVNKGGSIEKRQYLTTEDTSKKYELHIVNNGVDYLPLVLDSVEWVTEYADTAGKLTFNILKDSNIDIKEGNLVIFKANGFNVFYGYLFEKSRSKDGTISCTAYDQLRYFKNKDTYCYKNKKYSELLKMIADDYNLICSPNLNDTEYVIPNRVEDDETLFDILKNARELTKEATGKDFFLFDDFGSLNIRSTDRLVTDYLITDKSIENFDYKTSIDDEVYNRIQVFKDNDETGNRDMYIYEDGNTINEWGILQKTVKLEEGETPESTGNNNLNTYNKKKRTISVKGCFGDVRVRGGTSVFLSLNVGDIVYDNAKFIVSKASHKFGSKYSMDLELEEE